MILSRCFQVSGKLSQHVLLERRPQHQQRVCLSERPQGQEHGGVHQVPVCQRLRYLTTNSNNLWNSVLWPFFRSYRWFLEGADGGCYRFRKMRYSVTLHNKTNKLYWRIHTVLTLNTDKRAETYTNTILTLNGYKRDEVLQPQQIRDSALICWGCQTSQLK